MSLLQPRSPEYDAVWRPPIPLLEDRRPEAIARCRSTADVAAALAHARRHGLAVAVSSGGHCFGGRSSTEGLLIDVGPMDAVSVGDGVATIGAGARLGDVHDALDPTAHHGANHARLLRAKAEYDPDEGFGPYPHR